MLLPEWLADGTATLTLRPFDEALRERDTRRVDLGRRGGGRFRVEPLRTGRYDALVMLRNLTEPLVVVPDVAHVTFPVSDCAAALATAFLVDPILPAADACAGEPRPG